jgi:5'-nucleotidase (lipoprotein e(P4) family)
VLALTIVVMAGCATRQVERGVGGVVAVTTPPAAGNALAANIEPPRELVWYRTSAEMKAAYSQAYRIAGEKLPALAAGHAPGGWAVIMDADETILDNSESILRGAREHPARPHDFSFDSWNGWVREARAPALPGAKSFVDRVHALGGKVVVVTNRDDAVCEPTRRNLKNLGIVVEGVLCATDTTGNKNPRFASVRDGTSPLELPPLTVVAYVGDNIQDFPGRLQANPGSLDDFGESLFILPNPLYGSWDHNVLN